MKKILVSFAVISACLLSSAAAQMSAPSLALQDSLPIAEETLDKAGVNLAQYFLFSVVYTNSSKGPFWYYTFKPIAGGREIFVKIYMDKSIEVIGAPAAGRR